MKQSNSAVRRVLPATILECFNMYALAASAVGGLITIFDFFGSWAFSVDVFRFFALIVPFAASSCAAFSSFPVGGLFK